MKQKKTPKPQQMWDVCIMLKQGDDREPRHLSTPHYNLPYKLASTLGKAEESKPTNQKGTFYKLVKNGEKPTKQMSIPFQHSIPNELVVM